MSVKYTKEHEWIRLTGDGAVVGISAYAQEQLGEIVFVELPKTGAKLDKGAEAVVIESVKAASEVYAPATGEVTEVNGELDGDPGRVNADATGEGWLFKMTLADEGELDELMDEDAYKAYVEGLD
ncbi:MAG: glycine cleavage system protein GcvH [Rhodospirillales bacterium]